MPNAVTVVVAAVVFGFSSMVVAAVKEQSATPANPLERVVATQQESTCPAQDSKAGEALAKARCVPCWICSPCKIRR